MFDSKNKKSTVTLTALLVGILLLATAGSVGATLLIKSQTSINENTMDDSYLYISFSAPDTLEYRDLLGTVAFDTINSGGTASYVLHRDTDLNGDGINDAGKISTTHTMRVASTNGGNTFSLDVTVSDFTPVTGLYYWLKVGTQYVLGSTTAHYTSLSDYTETSFGWTIDGLACNTDLTVDLYVSATSDLSDSNPALSANPGATVGFTNYEPAVVSPPADAVTGSVFTFVAYTAL